MFYSRFFEEMSFDQRCVELEVGCIALAAGIATTHRLNRTATSPTVDIARSGMTNSSWIESMHMHYHILLRHALFSNDMPFNVLLSVHFAEIPGK
jgi:hypothetical protein